MVLQPYPHQSAQKDQNRESHVSTGPPFGGPGQNRSGAPGAFMAWLCERMVEKG
jgi:hypothetical protein